MSTSGDELRRLRLLQVEIQQGRATLARLAATADTYSRRINADSPQPELLAAVGLALHHVYTAVEEILLAIARTLDGGPLRGEAWHRSILVQLGRAVPGIRPAVLGPETLTFLDELRRFRHVVRHAYEYELDWRRLEPLVAGLQTGLALVLADLRNCEDFISNLMAAGGSPANS